jgi:diguanylate cyclase (GGDEF)-like protein
MGNEKNVDKKQSVEQSIITFPIVGFLIGFLFLIAFYTVAFLQASNLSSGKSFLDMVLSLHKINPTLFIADSLPLALTIIGFLSGAAQRRKLVGMKRLQAALEQQSRRMRSIQFLYTVMFDKSNDCLFVTVPEGEIVDINPAGARLLRIDTLAERKLESREDLSEILKAKRLSARSIYINEEDRKHLLEELRKNGKVSNITVRLRRLNGETFDALVSGFMEETSDGQPLIFGKIIDLGNVKQAEILLRRANEQLEKKNEELVKAFSELQALKVRYENRNKDLENLNQQLNLANRLLSDLAVTDGLTGLFNHKHFMGLLEKEWERSRRSKNSFCVIMIDVDYFKAFNDKWGHQLGDQALKSLARTIKRQTRSYDMVARYGGEEFSLLLPDTDLNTCYTVAQRIRKAVEKKALLIKSENTKVHLTVSVGVTIFLPEEDDPRTSEQVLQDADVALYLSKNRGRNRVEMYRRDMLSEAATVVPIPELNGEE